MTKDKIDVIIPAYKAHGTIIRCLSSIACQTIIEDVTVTIVNDCCPEGDYSEVVKTFSPIMDVREIRTPVNGGPGVARQLGIDSTDGEFIAFVDADDMLYKCTALDTLRKEMADKTCMCASGAFASDKYRDDPEKFSRMMVWLFAKLYRRDFLRKYNVRFNSTRANEDSGFNRIVYLRCDNPEEKIVSLPEDLYFYNQRDDSITNINGDLYYYDQGLIGGLENLILAIQHVKQYKPLSSRMLEETVSFMTNCYFEYAGAREYAPEFTIQLWEYIKKYYHTCYKQVDEYITDKAFRQAYSISMMSALKCYDLFGVIPKESIYEFMGRLRTEEYDPNLINEIRAEMEAEPTYQKVMKNNIACGVCKEG